MQLIEIVLSKEKKRSDGNYGSDASFASCKIIVHPGDDLDEVLAEGHHVVDRALAAAQPGPGGEVAVADRPQVRVKVSGGQPRDPKNADLKALGLRWDPNWKAWVADVSRADARRIAAVADELGFRVEHEDLKDVAP